MQTQQTPYSTLQFDWHKFEVELGQLTEDDSRIMQVLATRYCEALLANLDDRFPEPHVLSSFQIFDPLRVPRDTEERADYGIASLRVLIGKFESQIGNQDTVLNAYQLLKDYMIGAPFHHCKDAGDVCRLISKDSFYTKFPPELQKLANIALTIPLSMAWPERGFSTLSRVKTKQRNRLLDSTLSATINSSMNGPPALSEADALTIAEAWLIKKKRREVFPNASTASMAQYNDDDDSDDEDLGEFCDKDVDFEKFLL